LLCFETQAELMQVGTHRPRNVGWTRAAALLYGDWGTSKAYVIGLAFVAARYSSFPIILAVCLLTGLVGYNYIIVCRHFPDGGGVYSAAREQSRVLAVLGSLLLLADFIVTASMSCWDAMSYFGIPPEYLKMATIAFIVLIGILNFFGPKHSGSFAVTLALPMVVVVVAIIALSVPHLTLKHLEPVHSSFGKNWVAFVSVILALSGVEAIANLTGVMKLDPDATPEAPRVAETAKRAIWPVAIEVVVGTAMLGWAMLSLPQSMSDQISSRYTDMLRFLGEEYGTMTTGSPHFGHVFGVVIGLVVGCLLLSAVNTAVSAMIGLMYMLARDQEMPRSFAKLNSHGVPWPPLLVAVILPIILVIISKDLDGLADMYAIGVVGAITVNLGSSCFNKRLHLNWREFSIMLFTFVVLFAIEVTIAKTKSAALFFAACVLGIGFALRWYSMKRAGYETVMLKRELAAVIKPELVETLRPNLSAGQSILVAARGLTPVLRFALEEAKLREGNLYVLFVKQISVNLLGPLADETRPRWQDDPEAAHIMYGMFELAKKAGVSVLPVYAVSDNPSATILDITATLGVDMLMLGAPHRSAMAKLLRGDVVTEVAKNLPENIQLLIHS
jgi:amino acid transporter/nucleotide-binding universal stress UspA family protein